MHDSNDLGIVRSHNNTGPYFVIFNGDTYEEGDLPPRHVSSRDFATYSEALRYADGVYHGRYPVVVRKAQCAYSE